MSQRDLRRGAVALRRLEVGNVTLLCEEAEHRFSAMGIDLVRTMVRRNDIPVLSLFRSMGFVAGPFTEMEKALPVAARREEDVA